MFGTRHKTRPEGHERANTSAGEGSGPFPNQSSLVSCVGGQGCVEEAQRTLRGYQGQRPLVGRRTKPVDQEPTLS